MGTQLDRGGRHACKQRGGTGKDKDISKLGHVQRENMKGVVPGAESMFRRWGWDLDCKLEKSEFLQ